MEGDAPWLKPGSGSSTGTSICFGGSGEWAVRDPKQETCLWDPTPSACSNRNIGFRSHHVLRVP